MVAVDLSWFSSNLKDYNSLGEVLFIGLQHVLRKLLIITTFYQHKTNKRKVLYQSLMVCVMMNPLVLTPNLVFASEYYAVGTPQETIVDLLGSHR